jgi:hypothetical protein
MKTCALIPLLCMLASVSAFPEHNNAAALARRLNPRRHHNQAERMVENIKRQESTQGTLAGKRIVTKRGQTCRVRPGAASASSSAAASSTTSAAAAASTVADAAGYNANAPSAQVLRLRSIRLAYKLMWQPAATTAAWEAPAPAAPSAAAPSPAAPAPAPIPAAPQQNSGGLTPNGRKAGISAGDSLKEFENQIGWYYSAFHIILFRHPR